MWIVDESAAFQDGYVEISNRNIGTDTSVVLNVIMSENRCFKALRLWRGVKRMSCLDNQGHY